MYCRSVDKCYEQISAYLDSASMGFPGFPLVVNTENYNVCNEIRNRYFTATKMEPVNASEHTFENGTANIEAVKKRISAQGRFFCIGISQAQMFRGEDALDQTIGEILSLSIQGKAIVLLFHCRRFLEKYLRRDVRLDDRIVLMEGEPSSPLPSIRLASNPDFCEGLKAVKGLKACLTNIENMSDEEIERHPTITVVTHYSTKAFTHSMYKVYQMDGMFDVLQEKYPDLAPHIEKEFGTNEQWSWLWENMKRFNGFASFVSSVFKSCDKLGEKFADVFSLKDKDNKYWLLWLALKVFGASDKPYLNFALSQSRKCSDLEEHIYMALLDLDRDDERFERFYKERKELINDLSQNGALMASYCNNVGIRGKDAVYYLTDSSKDEEYAFTKLVFDHTLNKDEILDAARHGFPELALYLHDFVFDVVNTKLPKSEESFRDVLTLYFNRYKYQKIQNRIDPNFLEFVKNFAVERPFFKLQSRGSILSAMDREGAEAFFFDALGVEYLAYIIAKCKDLGLTYEVSIARCELPSITTKNKEFEQYFSDDKIRKIKELDELKHHSLEYDYQKCPYPIHIFEELRIIDKVLESIRTKLYQESMTKAVVISDHGASRLAVLYQHENNSTLKLDEKGEHSGRCCPADEDPGINEAAYEDGYVVLGNYERFKGGRKANLEVHGGAALEEVVVPIITLALKPEDVKYSFVKSTVAFKMNKPVELTLFCNKSMKQPRLLVDEVYYDGKFLENAQRALFTMDLKRSGEYKAVVYEGAVNTGVELTFVIERKTKDNSKGRLGI